jgi:hypothetical protein
MVERARRTRMMQMRIQLTLQSQCSVLEVVGNHAKEESFNTLLVRAMRAWKIQGEAEATKMRNRGATVRRA